MTPVNTSFVSCETVGVAEGWISGVEVLLRGVADGGMLGVAVVAVAGLEVLAGAEVGAVCALENATGWELQPAANITTMSRERKLRRDILGSVQGSVIRLFIRRRCRGAII
jgi:hypothetical protein